MGIEPTCKAYGAFELPVLYPAMAPGARLELTFTDSESVVLPIRRPWIVSHLVLNMYTGIFTITAIVTTHTCAFLLNHLMFFTILFKNIHWYGREDSNLQNLDSKSSTYASSVTPAHY